MRTLLTFFFALLTVGIFAQNTDVPVQINLKDGGSIDAKHFGQWKCGNQSSLIDNYVLIRGKFMGNLTEIKDYDDIEKLILEGFTTEPKASSGNEKGTVYVQKKNGKTFTLEDAEIVLSCYGVGDKYNEIIVQIKNPISGQIGETVVATKDISSIIFK
jgi:hypothetical protein